MTLISHYIRNYFSGVLSYVYPKCGNTVFYLYISIAIIAEETNFDDF